MNLRKRNLDCLGDPKILEIPKSGDIWQGKLPKRKKRVVVNKEERSWRVEEGFDIRHGHVEFVQTVLQLC